MAPLCFKRSDRRHDEPAVTGGVETPSDLWTGVLVRHVCAQGFSPFGIGHVAVGDLAGASEPAVQADIPQPNGEVVTAGDEGLPSGLKATLFT